LYQNWKLEAIFELLRQQAYKIHKKKVDIKEMQEMKNR
jgi:hypothetical protein